MVDEAEILKTFNFDKLSHHPDQRIKEEIAFGVGIIQDNFPDGTYLEYFMDSPKFIKMFRKDGLINLGEIEHLQQADSIIQGVIETGQYEGAEISLLMFKAPHYYQDDMPHYVHFVHDFEINEGYCYLFSQYRIVEVEDKDWLKEGIPTIDADEMFQIIEEEKEEDKAHSMDWAE